jgi:hypothetical protein
MENIDKEFMKLKIQKQLEHERAERAKRIREYWETETTPFKEPHEVPTIPRAEPEEYKNFYVPKLIQRGAIPKLDLIHGQVYIGDTRNATTAKWNAEKQEFEYWRYKFGNTYIDTCNHFEDDNGFALFVPIRLGEEKDWKKVD